MIYCTIKKLKCFWRETSLISRMPPFFTAGFRLGSGNSGSKLSLFLGGFFAASVSLERTFAPWTGCSAFLSLITYTQKRRRGLLFCTYCCSPQGFAEMMAALS